MSPRRKAAPPPDLTGYTFVEPIGSGGFADVYLYEQKLPRRRVAVKVLHTDRISDQALKEFTDEANAMALVSTHPSIVTIHAAGTASDGRPYLVMEHAPGANLQTRYRHSPLSVAETLRVGVQIAAAVETAHRAGILHRDIKPANILTTEYNNPALTDFGIASTSALETAAGLSIPWSAPELFAEKPFGGAEADVYALSATLYTLLEGRSPFERPGITSVDLIDRIERDRVPAMQRADVPAALQDVLLRAMAKSPQDRFPTALAFARALQRVQIQQAHGVTPVDIIDDAAEADVETHDDDVLTRVRSLVSIAPHEAPAADVPVAALPPSASEHLGRGALDVEPRRMRRLAARQPRGFWNNPRARNWTIAAACGAALVVALASTVAALQPDDAPRELTSQPKDIAMEVVPTPADAAAVVDGANVVVTWTNPDPKSGDRYYWRYEGVDVDKRPHAVTETTAMVPKLDAPQTCVAVAIRRADGSFSNTEAMVCAP